MFAAFLRSLAHGGNLSLATVVMASMYDSDTEDSSESDAASCLQTSADAWLARQAQSVNHHSVSLRRELDVSSSQANRQTAFLNRQQAFLTEYDIQYAQSPSIINTEEVRDLRNWCMQNSWSFCKECGHLSFQKLLPSFRTSTSSPVNKNCKCGGESTAFPRLKTCH